MVVLTLGLGIGASTPPRQFTVLCAPENGIKRRSKSLPSSNRISYITDRTRNLECDGYFPILQTRVPRHAHAAGQYRIPIRLSALFVAMVLATRNPPRPPTSLLRLARVRWCPRYPIRREHLPKQVPPTRGSLCASTSGGEQLTAL